MEAATAPLLHIPDPEAVAPPWSALFSRKEIAPLLELGAWEWLWLNRADTYAGIAALFRRTPDTLPSDLVPEAAARSTARHALAELARAGINSFSLQIHGMADYPSRLQDAPDPVPVLYCQGWSDLLAAPRQVAVVGTRAVSEKGIRRTRKLVRMLVERHCTIVSGLGRGVDTAAHEEAIDAGGATIGVIGTPLSDCDTKPHTGLQRRIARDFLLLSPVPVLACRQRAVLGRRTFYPERGRTMATLADATIIVEAGQVSGTLVQAEAALRLGRKLFILNGCFDQPGVTWPARLEALGAIRVRQFEQILDALRGQDRHAAPAHR